MASLLTKLRLSVPVVGLVRATGKKRSLNLAETSYLVQITRNYVLQTNIKAPESPREGKLENIQTKITDNEKSENENEKTQVNLSNENLSQLHSNVPEKKRTKSKEITEVVPLLKLMSTLKKKNSSRRC